MASLERCPGCGRRAEMKVSSNWFQVYTCWDCGHKFCDHCSGGRGVTCPDCGSTSYGKTDEVYA